MSQEEARDDQGATLIELLMAIAITSIIGAMIMGTIFTLGRITGKITEQTDDNIAAKRVLDVISTNLRGATVDPARPTQPQLVIAHPGEVKFLTYGGRGFSEPPRWLHYRAKQGKIFQVDPVTQTERPIMTNSFNGQIFQFYRWDDDGVKDRHGNCFVSLTPDELKTEEGRRSIVAVQIQIERLSSKQYQNNRKHTGAWVRLSEQITPFDPVKGHSLETWKNTCWETQYGRVGKKPNASVQQKQ